MALGLGCDVSIDTWQMPNYTLMIYDYTLKLGIFLYILIDISLSLSLSFYIKLNILSVFQIIWIQITRKSLPGSASSQNISFCNSRAPKTIKNLCYTF